MRPGVLKEWPLEEFLSDSSMNSSSKVPPLSPLKKQKRPLSPSGPPILFSPTKRRILTQEGVFCPEKVLKSPIRDRSVATTLFPPKEEPSAPQASSLPSPKPTCLPSLVPRELPSLPESASIHYPGFPVHRDPYTVVWPPAVDSDESCGEEDDEPKENLPPRKKMKKAAGTPTIKPPLFSPPMQKIELHTPATPTKKAALERPLPGSPTPRRNGFVLTSSTHTTPVVSESERRERKRILEHEVDHPDTVSDSDTDE